VDETPTYFVLATTIILQHGFKLQKASVKNNGRLKRQSLDQLRKASDQEWSPLSAPLYAMTGEVAGRRVKGSGSWETMLVLGTPCRQVGDPVVNVDI
jgi:hypothetical protein